MPSTINRHQYVLILPRPRQRYFETMSASPIAQYPVTEHLAPNASLSMALRNTLLTLIVTVGSLALAGYLAREQGYEMLIVTMGWPHVLLGFLFYFGRVWRGEPNTRLSFLLLTTLTLTFWVIHYNYLITGLIYIYFLYHAFRDEIFVYLQTRARHRTSQSVYAVAGVGPLILLMLLVPQQQDFRQDLRRVELTGDQLAVSDWTLISFKPVENSAGRNFYFYLQAPHTEGLQAFITQAGVANQRDDGEMLVGDHEWAGAKDLTFRPHYARDSASQPAAITGAQSPVLLTGGHKVGQTFRADENHLDGIWLPIERLERQPAATQFVFHLASPPLLPYSRLLSILRLVLLVVLGLYVFYRLLPRAGQTSQLWIYLLVLVVAFAGTQMILKSSSNAGYPFPLIFQFVVVFHYWSWYVFSFDKLRAGRRSFPGSAQSSTPTHSSHYDRMLDYLRSAPYFTGAVIALNLISAAGVVWYYRLNGPASLRFGFDYSYFLYFLVLHVTFSFKPQMRWRKEIAKVNEAKAIRSG